MGHPCLYVRLLDSNACPLPLDPNIGMWLLVTHFRSVIKFVYLGCSHLRGRPRITRGIGFVDRKER